MSGYPDDVTQASFDRYWSDRLGDYDESEIDPTPEEYGDGRNRPHRRERLPGCVLCDQLIADGTTFAPPHDASDGCESGKHDHCTCDTCF